jgi:hypothetical protein
MSTQDSTNTPTDHSLEARRAFLRKAGRFAAYTPPTIMLLMHPSAKSIAASGGCCNPGPFQAEQRQPKPVMGTELPNTVVTKITESNFRASAPRGMFGR